jgi:hypothetical protein
MSAYIELLTPMTDLESLLNALADLGFDASKVEVHQKPVSLFGYAGDERDSSANIVIRRQNIGISSNDIGFLETAIGYRALISGFDHPRFGVSWLSQLNECYRLHLAEKEARLIAEEQQRIEAERQRVVEAQRAAIHERARSMGYSVKEISDGNSIRLVLIKRQY